MALSFQTPLGSLLLHLTSIFWKMFKKKNGFFTGANS